MTRRSPRYLSANGPINPRTAPAATDTRRAGAAPRSFAVRQRCRAQLGPGLRRQAALPPAAGRHSLRRALRWLASGVLIASASLAALQGTWPWLAAAIAAAGACLLLRLPPDADRDAAGVGLAAAELDAFDRLLAAAAGELSEAQRATLREIKSLIAEIAGGAGAADAACAFDDRLYAAACVRRYVPDSLSAFLRVPVALRCDRSLAGGDSAEALLTRQLALVRAELQRCRVRRARRSVGALLLQQRFLETGRAGGGETESPVRAAGCEDDGEPHRGCGLSRVPAVRVEAWQGTPGHRRPSPPS